MRYFARNEHGELGFESIDRLREAYRQGLVDSTDEVREEGSSVWRPASQLPILALIRTESGLPLAGGRFALVALALCMGLMALYFLMSGQWYVGLALAIALCLVLTRVTYRAFKKGRSLV